MTYPVKLVGDVAQHNGGANISAGLNAGLVHTVVDKLRVIRLVDRLSWNVDLSVAEIDKTTLIILARIVAMRRVRRTRTSPVVGRVDSPHPKTLDILSLRRQDRQAGYLHCRTGAP